MCSARPSLAPSVCAIVSVTSAGSRTAARPTQKTPAVKAGTSSEAASTASRVLPEPPGPERVTRRVPFRSRPTSSSRSRSLPTKEEAGRGRFVFEIVFSGGKRSLPELEERDRLGEVLQPVLAELGQLAVDERPRRRRDHDLAAVARRRRSAPLGAARARRSPRRSGAAPPCAGPSAP